MSLMTRNPGRRGEAGDKSYQSVRTGSGWVRRGGRACGRVRVEGDQAWRHTMWFARFRNAPAVRSVSWWRYCSNSARAVPNA